MRRALELAASGGGNLSPNPAVGAVIVKNGRIIGEGFHKGPGTLHAEIEAIENAVESVEGATLYCTLEPCCASYGGKRQPPCTERIIKERIGKVVIAARDPNERVNGKGMAALESAGISLTAGILEAEAERLNEVYNINQKEKRAFVHLKMAQTLDGRIATKNGDSKWITDVDARKDVHRFRSLYDAVLVGAGTVRADNPKLDTRLIENGKNPIRIVLSRSLAFTEGLEIFSDENRTGTIIATGSDSPEDKKQHFAGKGIQIIEITDLHSLLKELYRKGVCSVFVEGGSEVYTSFLQQKLFDRLSIYTAPIICGKGIEAVGDLKTGLMNASLTFGKTEFLMINNQTVFHGWRGECLQD